MSIVQTKKAIIDLETTGTHLQKDRILEIAIVLMDGEKVEEEWSSLISPEGVSISPFISQLTGINTAMCQFAPAFSDIAATVLDKLKDRVVYAHNARFDYAFLKQAFARCQYEFFSPYVCTVKLSKMLYPHHRKHNLDAVRERLQLPTEDRHRALGDTRTVLHFIQHLFATQSKENVERILQTITDKPVLPSLMKQKNIDVLPTGPGVYIFKDEKKQILYVGKSISIKKRVQSHFYSTTRDTKELTLFNQVAEIETIETATEFEALVEESKLVKALMPVYNRKLRRQQTFCIVTTHENKEGYLTLAIQRNKHVTIEDITGVICLFRTQRAARQTLIHIAEKEQLCQKYMGLEKATSACFAYHLDQCLGACVQKETKDNYNQRLLSSLEALAIKSWPYKGPIFILNANEKIPRYHMIYKWSYIKSFDTLSEAKNSLILNEDKTLQFDLDQYQIITSFLYKTDVTIITL